MPLLMTLLINLVRLMLLWNNASYLRLEFVENAT